MADALVLTFLKSAQTLCARANVVPQAWVALHLRSEAAMTLQNALYCRELTDRDRNRIRSTLAQVELAIDGFDWRGKI
jgi:hypothetical protein